MAARQARYTKANDQDDDDDEVDVLLPSTAQTSAPKRVPTVSVAPAPARRMCTISRMHIIFGVVLTLAMAVVMLLWMFSVF